jgi:hypothetical protein
MELTSTLNFTSNNEILIHMSTGDSRPPIPVRVCEFQPPNGEFLRVPDLNSKSRDQLQPFLSVATLPYAIRNPNAVQVKQVCIEHIEAISKQEYISGDPESIRFKLLRAICRFQQVDPVAKGVSTYPSCGLDERG